MKFDSVFNTSKTILRRHWHVSALLFVVFVSRLYIIGNYPVVKSWGDEDEYVEFAHRNSTWTGKLKELVPSQMCFELWPPFAYSVYGMFATEGLTRAYRQNEPINPNEQWNSDFAGFFRRVAFFNLALFLLVGLSVYLLSMTIGFKEVTATVAAALFLLNPRMAFYVQALWPELLHLALFMLALLLVIKYNSRNRYGYLVTSGVLFGFCALTKRVVDPYLLLLLGLLFFHSYYRKKNTLKSVLKPLVILYGCYAIVLVPQLIANYRSYGMFAVSTNRWLNIELGVIPYEGVDLVDRYNEAAMDPQVREKLSKERVRDYLGETPKMKVLSNQIAQFVSKQLNRSFLWLGYRGDRWRDTVSRTSVGTIQVNLSIALSWALLLFGIGGLVTRWRRSFGDSAIVLFLVYYLAALFIVPFNSRFFIQAAPFLGILTVAFIMRAWRSSADA